MKVTLLKTLTVVTVLQLCTFASKAQAPWPLGTYTSTTATVSDCPAGFTCYGYTVSNCVNVTNSLNGFIGVGHYTSAVPRGVVMFFTGGAGNSWWTNAETNTTANPALVAFSDSLRMEGFTVVQVRWSGAWLHSSVGNDAGPGHLGARPATVIRHVYDSIYVPMGIAPCKSRYGGFVITGNSGGSSQVSYAISHFGLDSILDVVIPTEGPVMSVLSKSMLGGPSNPYFYSSLRGFIDKGFGYFDGTGPGANMDSSFIPRWEEESHTTGGNDFYHPDTHVHFIWTTDGMRTVGTDYYNRLIAEGSPDVTFEDVANTPHLVVSTQQGRDALWKVIVGTPCVPTDNGPGEETIPGNLLGQNTPNPFNSITNIEYKVLKSGLTRLKVCDIVGREVAVLVNKELKAGNYKAVFDAGRLPGGVYFYTLETGTSIQIKKMMLIN